MKRYHILIVGQVQGVGFRYFLQAHARKLNIKGWVKNSQDSVEVVAEGQTHDIELFVGFCKKGPMHAHIEKIAIDDESPTRAFLDFEILD